MSCILHDLPQSFVIRMNKAVDEHRAVLVPRASFCDGEECEIHIDFYLFEGRVVRREYNQRNTMTLYQYVWDSDLEDFFMHYGSG